MPVAIEFAVEMREVGERARDRDVGQRQPVADQIAAVIRHHRLEIIEDRRQLVALGGRGGILVARPLEKARRDDPVEEHLGPARREDRVGELVKPDGLPAKLRIGRDQRRLGMLGLEIMDDRARIGEAVIAVHQRRHLLERARGPEIHVGLGSERHDVELDALLGRESEHLANERRERRTVENHGDAPPSAGQTESRL